jgi:hypothetical protein
MYNNRGLNVKTTFIVIVVSLISFTLFASITYGSNWVFVKTNDNFTIYYDSDSIKIDKNRNIISVKVVRVYSDNYISNLDNLFKNLKGVKTNKYTEVSHSLQSYLINYKELKYRVINMKHYSNSGKILSEGNSIPWTNIKPDSEVDILANQILENNDIQR